KGLTRSYVSRIFRKYEFIHSARLSDVSHPLFQDFCGFGAQVPRAFRRRRGVGAVGKQSAQFMPLLCFAVDGADTFQSALIGGLDRKHSLQAREREIRSRNTMEIPVACTEQQLCALFLRQ